MDDSVAMADIDDILTAAFEGGSTYWCLAVRVLSVSDAFRRVRDEIDGTLRRRWASEIVSTPGAALAVLDDEGNWHPLDRERIESGIRQAAERYRMTIEQFVEEHDAGDADVALQLAIFGEVVYG